MNKTKTAFGVCIGLILVLGIFVAGCTTTPATSPGTPSQTTVLTQNTPTPSSTTTLKTVTTLPAAATIPIVQHATYTNSPYGITMSYPKDWDAQEASDLAVRDYGKDTINIVNFYSPGKDSYVTFSVDVDPSTTTDLEKYYNTAIIALQATYPHWEMTKHNAQLKVSDNFAYRIDYRIPHEDSTKTDYGLQVYTIVKGTPYIFTYQAKDLTPTDETYTSNLDEAQDMIKSVSINPVTVTAKSR